MRIDTGDSSTRACASQILKALPRRLRPPPLKSRTTVSYVQHEVPGATQQPAPRRWITAHHDAPRRSEQWPPPDNPSLPTGSPPNPNCPGPRDERHQDNQWGYRQPVGRAKMCSVAAWNVDIPEAMINCDEYYSRQRGARLRSRHIATASAMLTRRRPCQPEHLDMPPPCPVLPWRKQSFLTTRQNRLSQPWANTIPSPAHAHQLSAASIHDIE